MIYIYLFYLKQVKKYYCHSHSCMEAKNNEQRMLKSYKSFKMNGDGYDDRLVELKICNDIFKKFTKDTA